MTKRFSYIQNKLRDTRDVAKIGTLVLAFAFGATFPALMCATAGAYAGWRIAANRSQGDNR